MTDDRQPRILIAEPDDFSGQALARLREHAEVELRAIAKDEMAAALDAYDVVWFRLGHQLTAPLVQGAKRCRILACAVTGLDHIDLAACEAKGIAVLSLRGEVEFLREVRATAEHAVGLALALIRKLPAAVASVERGTWDRDPFRGSELFRKTAGIVGVGRLGSIVGGYLAALGMEVLGVDPKPFDDPAITRVDSLEELLSRADLVSLHVPLAPETHHMIGADELRAMKPSAVLINTSRGAVLDDRALLAALETGALAGAALDVVEGEPHLGEDHPLLRYAARHDNLVITPHIGGNTHESFDKTEVFIANKILRALGVQP